MAPDFNSPHMVAVSNTLWAATSIVGAVLCSIMLLITAIIATYRDSRAHLDRVSFRIVATALVANMAFGVVSAIGGTRTGPGPSCGLSIFILQFTLEISCFLFFCIALNLQLVVVHGINSQKLERFYFAGSIVAALAITIPPYASGQYGWDPLIKTCWYTNHDKAQRLAWQIGTQLVWTGFTSISEVIAAIVVTVYMLRVHWRRASIASNSAGTQSTPVVIHANAYKTVIIRIALYPMASCVINLTSIACVIHATVRGGISTQNDYNILLLSDFLYGGRAIVYALLYATDPALVRGIRTFVEQRLGWRWPGKGSPSPASLASRKDSFAVRVELSTIYDTDYSGAARAHKRPYSSVMKMGEGAYAHSEGPVEQEGPQDDKASASAVPVGMDSRSSIEIREPPVRQRLEERSRKQQNMAEAEEFGKRI